MRIGPLSGSCTFDFVSVSKSCIDPAKRLVARQGRDHRPELGPTFLAGQGHAHGAQAAADGLQLAKERARVDVAVAALEQLAKALERLRRIALDRARRREDRPRVRPRLVQVARAAQRRDDLGRGVGLERELLVAHRLDRLDREPADAGQVVVDVVLRQAELLEVAAHGGTRYAGLPQRGDGRTGCACRQLLAVLAEDQPVVDELRRVGAERLDQPSVQGLVGTVVEAAHDVRDAEVDVVDDAGEVVRRAAVLAQQRDAVEAVAERGARLTVSLRALALAHGAGVPFDPEPLQVGDELGLAARNVPRGIRVVDAQQHPVAQLPVRDGAESVADMQRTGGARSETHPLHLRPSLESALVEAALLAWFDAHGRDLPWRRTRDPYAILVSEVMLQQTQVDRVVPRYLDWLGRWPTVDLLAVASPA